MALEQTFVIVGASLAGAKAAEMLRAEGFDGRVVLIGEEAERPYERPMLSKEYLRGDKPAAKLYVHDEGFYADNDIELLTGTRVASLEPGAHEITLADGSRMPYSRLLLSTGATPRRLPLPGAEMAGVCYLRAMADSDALRAAIKAASRVVVIGAGWIGSEVAASARQMGAEVAMVAPEVVPLERVLGPLLGGVYAGRADRLSLYATLPQLVAPVARSRSLLLATRQARATATPYTGPLFRGLPGGLGRLPAAVANASGARVRLSTTVRALARTPTGWRLDLGSVAHPEQLDVDGVVLAIPAAPAARLLRDLAPAAAEGLAGLEYASVAIVTLVLDGATPGAGSGYLVPAVDGRVTKAVTFTSRKWGHYPAGRAVVRASVGRHGDATDLQRDDAELVDVVRAELVAAVGPVARTLDSRVVRWGGGLPQYAVGHLDLVHRVRAAVAAHPGLAVAGAAYGGVGIPAVARDGRDAARQVLAAHLVDDRTHDRRPA